MTYKIALIGQPSAGKSTLAALAFAEFKTKKHKTELVQEYVREHINKYGVPSNILTQYLVSRRQRERESIIPKTIDVMITDSPTMLSYIYALEYADFTNIDHRLLVTELYSDLINLDLSNYNKIYYLESNKPYIEDGTRYQTAEQASKIGDKIYGFLVLHRLEFTVLDQSMDNYARSKKIIEDYEET